MKKNSYWTPARRERQGEEHRKSGRYARVNPCQRCGKSAGVDYYSVLCDQTDSLGNEWHDSAICVCQKCAKYLEDLVESNPEAAWMEIKSQDYGSLPQGKVPKK